jgi:hypothetical protein
VHKRLLNAALALVDQDQAEKVKQPLTFFLTLALRLGRTLHELRSTLTASELKMWIAYDRVSPIGDWRGDVQAAQISAAAFNAQGGKRIWLTCC